MSCHPFLAGPTPLAFAHRGGAAEAPENTRTAFARALGMGYGHLETDVHATADGVLAVLHDPTLERVSDARGAVADLPWERVGRARLAGGEVVPRFDELLTAFPTARWNVDVKAEAALAPLLALLERTDGWDRVCVGSFEESRLRRARAAAGPRLATSLGRSAVARLRLASWRLPLDVPAGAVCVQVPAAAGLVPVADAAFVAAAHARGLQVHVWTVDERREMERLLDLGVDGIMTDRIGLLREVLTERGTWQR